MPSEGPLLAESTAADGVHIAAIEGDRPSTGTNAASMTTSNSRLLGDFKSVVDLDTQVLHGRSQLGVAKQKLDG